MDAYLGEIAKGYGVPWSLNPPETSEKVCLVLSLQSATHYHQKTDPVHGVAQEDQGTGDKVEKGGKGPELPSAPVVEKVEKEEDFDVLAKRFAALKKR